MSGQTRPEIEYALAIEEMDYGPEGNYFSERADVECRKARLAPVRAVISSLPFACLPASVQDGVIRCLGRLVRRGCHFRTYQYVHAYLLPSAARFRRKMDACLGPHRLTATIVGNVPPAFVLTWKR